MDNDEAGDNEEQKVCPYYPLGKCRMGASCKWRHVGEPPERKERAPSNIDIEHDEEQVCPFFAKGKCTYGNSCMVGMLSCFDITGKWSHPGAQSQEPCPYYTKGKCYYGAQCKFKHINNNNSENYPYPAQFALQPIPFPLLSQLPYPTLALPHTIPVIQAGYPLSAFNFPFPAEAIQGKGINIVVNSSGLPMAPVVAPQVRTTDGMKPCRYWQQGHCPYESCKFSHQVGAGGSPTDSLKRPGGFPQDEQTTKRAKIDSHTLASAPGVGVTLQLPLQLQHLPQQPGYSYPYGYQ
jgi:hypothetical protein